MAVSFTVCHYPLERMVNFLLCYRGFRDIIDTKNKNAAAYGCANTRKPAQVSSHLYNGLKPFPHGILYDIPSFFARVPLPYPSRYSHLYGGICFSHCVGLHCAVFLFFDRPPGVETPLGGIIRMGGKLCWNMNFPIFWHCVPRLKAQRRFQPV